MASQKFLMNFDLQQEISDLDLESINIDLEHFVIQEINTEDRESILESKVILKQLGLMTEKDQDKFINNLLTGLNVNRHGSNHGSSNERYSKSRAI